MRIFESHWVVLSRTKVFDCGVKSCNFSTFNGVAQPPRAIIASIVNIILGMVLPLRHNVAVHPTEGRGEAPLPRFGCNGLLGSSFANTNTDEVADEEHYHHRINGNGDSDLLPEVLRTVGENKADEDELAEAGNRQN